jgi:Fe-S cluster assembly ATPase SufC
MRTEIRAMKLEITTMIIHESRGKNGSGKTCTFVG